MTGVVLDTSAIVAVLQAEPGSERLVEALEASWPRHISAAIVVEAGIVIHARWGDHGERELDLLLQRAEVDVVPLSPEQSGIARRACRRFGKGRHPAGLNFGHWFSYALAVAVEEPLLFVGSDFPRTDVTPAVPR